VNGLRDLFLHPSVTDAYELGWTDADVEAAKRMLVDEHDFSEDRVQGALERVAEARGKAGQRALDQWS